MASRGRMILPAAKEEMFYTETLQRFEEALDFFRRALERGPGNWKPKYHLDWIYESTGDLDRAKTQYEMAAEILSHQSSGIAYPFESLARIHLQQQKPAEAMRCTLRALALNPVLASSRLLLGNIYLQSGEHDKGISELRIAAELDATDPAPHYMLARACIRAGRPADARKEEETFK